MLDGKTLARIGAIAFVALAIVAAVIDMSRPDDDQDDVAMPGPAVIGRDPLDAELARCGGLGEAGPRDPSCLKAWAENRRRFLGQSTSGAPSAPASFPAPAPLSSSALFDAPASVPAPAVNGGR